MVIQLDGEVIAQVSYKCGHAKHTTCSSISCECYCHRTGRDCGLEMTAEERSERARNAVTIRWFRKRQAEAEAV